MAGLQEDRWREGDILFLKEWSDKTCDAYADAGISQKQAKHPAVLLYRSSPKSRYLVVAQMTSMRGQKLGSNPHSRLNPHAYIPVFPAPDNPHNPLSLYLVPRPPSNSNSHVNVLAISCVLDVALGRFRDVGSYTDSFFYRLRPDSFRQLLNHVERSHVFLNARRKADEKDDKKSRIISQPVIASERLYSAPSALPDPHASSSQRPSLPLLSANPHVPFNYQATSPLTAAIRQQLPVYSYGSPVPIASRPRFDEPRPAHDDHAYFWRRNSEHQPLLGEVYRYRRKSVFSETVCKFVFVSMLVLVFVAILGGVFYGIYAGLTALWHLAVLYLSPQSIWTGLQNFASWLWTGISSAVSWLWNVVTSAIQDLVSWLSDLIKALAHDLVSKIGGGNNG